MTYLGYCCKDFSDAVDDYIIELHEDALYHIWYEVIISRHCGEKSYVEHDVILKYCPFCGEKL